MTEDSEGEGLAKCKGSAKRTIGMFYVATEWGFLCADGRFELDLRRATNYESFSAANAQAKSYSTKGRMRFTYWAIVKPAVWENLRPLVPPKPLEEIDRD